MQKAGASSYVLEDGRTWNATHLSLVPESVTDVITGPAAPLPEPEPAQPLDANTPRPAWDRKRPA